MIALTEYEIEHYGEKIIEHLMNDKSFNKFTMIEMVALLSSAIYILGRETGERVVSEYEADVDNIDKAA